MGGRIGVESEVGRGQHVLVHASRSPCGWTDGRCPPPDRARSTACGSWWSTTTPRTAASSSTCSPPGRCGAPAWRAPTPRSRSCAGEPRSFDVALLDFHMPRADGLDLAAVVIAERLLDASRMVLLTSSGLSQDARPSPRDGFRRGADEAGQAVGAPRLPGQGDRRASLAGRAGGATRAQLCGCAERIVGHRPLPGRRRQRGQPQDRPPHARTPRPRGRHRRERPGGARRGADRALRRGADGLPDARDGRLPGHPGDPVTRRGRRADRGSSP